MRAIAAIAINTLKETVRQPAYGLVLIVACVVLLASSTAFVGHIYTFGAGSDLDNPAERMVADIGLSTILLAGMALGILSTVNVVHREIENRTAATVLSKRISRSAFMAGKFFGVGGAVGLACVTCLFFLMLTMRAGVNIMASDRYDWGVLGGMILSLVIALLVATARNYYWRRAWIGTFTLVFMSCIFVLFVIFTGFDKVYHPVFFPALSGEALDAISGWDREKVGVLYDYETMKAGITMIMAVLLMTSIALVAATRLAPGGNLAVTGFVAAMGLTSQYCYDKINSYASSTAYWNEYFGVTFPQMLYNVYYALIPNLQHFWMSDALGREEPIPWIYVGQCGVYAIFYLVAMLGLSMFLFERREVN